MVLVEQGWWSIVASASGSGEEASFVSERASGRASMTGLASYIHTHTRASHPRAIAQRHRHTHTETERRAQRHRSTLTHVGEGGGVRCVIRGWVCLSIRPYRPVCPCSPCLKNVGIPVCANSSLLRTMYTGCSACVRAGLGFSASAQQSSLSPIAFRACERYTCTQSAWTLCTRIIYPSNPFSVIEGTRF